MYRRILLDGSEDGAKTLMRQLCTPVGFRKDLGDELQGEGLAGLLPYIRLGTVSPLWVLGVLKLCGESVPQVGVCAVRCGFVYVCAGGSVRQQVGIIVKSSFCLRNNSNCPVIHAHSKMYCL